MLALTIPSVELFDESKGLFIETKEQKLQLEHSLVSLSKWESKWKKPFLSRDPKTAEESIDYIRFMTITQNVPPEVYDYIQDKEIQKVREYIDDPMTATTFQKVNQTGNREIITSELIYYWMIASGVPFECQKWHLNRLLTLINVCMIKNEPKKNMSRQEILNRNKALNASRRESLQTRG